MNNYNTYSVLFFIRNEKLNKHGKVPVYMRITINGKHAEISTRQWIESARWNNAGAIKGNNIILPKIRTTG
ncbi:MAG: Arm DNA-binding domain-containing protein [Bacteroidales bacterium]